MSSSIVAASSRMTSQEDSGISLSRWHACLTLDTSPLRATGGRRADDGFRFGPFTIFGDGHGCELAVQDTGPGMPDEVRERVFEPFFTTKTRGTGLGLPTVKRIVEAHHGTIALECPPSGGTRVRVTLPAVGENPLLRGNSPSKRPNQP